MEKTLISVNEADGRNFDFDGLKVDMSAAIGDFFVKRFVSELTEKDLEKIYDFLNKEVFQGYSYEYEHAETAEEKKEFAKTVGKWGAIQTKENHTYGYNNKEYLMDYAKEKFHNKFSKIVSERIDELLKTEKYQKRADKVAQDILDYSIDGWKNDAICRIRCRMIDDNVDGTYYGRSIRSIIQEEIQNTLNR